MRRLVGNSIAALSVLSLVLAACGSSSEPAPAASSSAPPASKAAPSVAASSTKPASSAAAASANTGPGEASAAGSGLIQVKAAFSQVTASQGVLFAGLDQKFFQQYGLDVSAERLGGTNQVPALANGELQFGSIGGNELVTANAGGEPLVMIASSSNVPVVSLYGGKGITDVTELTGKAIAITSPGSTTDAAAQIFLKHYGLEKEVKRQPAGTSQAVLAVLLNGDAAGGIFAPPTSLKAEQAGLKELVDGPKLAVPFVEAGTAVTRQFLKSKPDIVKRYLQGYYRAWKFATAPSNEAAVEQTIAKWTKSDMKMAKVAYDYLMPAWQRKGMPMVDVEGLKSVAAVSANRKAKDVDLNHIFDNSSLQAIAAGG